MNLLCIMFLQMTMRKVWYCIVLIKTMKLCVGGFSYHLEWYSIKLHIYRPEKLLLHSQRIMNRSFDIFKLILFQNRRRGRVRCWSRRNTSCVCSTAAISFLSLFSGVDNHTSTRWSSSYCWWYSCLWSCTTGIMTILQYEIINWWNVTDI